MLNNLQEAKVAISPRNGLLTSVEKVVLELIHSIAAVTRQYSNDSEGSTYRHTNSLSCPPQDC